MGFGCNVCPRSCNADRINKFGYCGCGVNARVAKVVKDFAFEEPCIGICDAVFFSGCTLRCDYCQNREISRGAIGKEYNAKSLAELFDSLSFSIDLITPTHFLSVIEEAVSLTQKPHRYIWNTSGYETAASVEREKKFVSVFLTDFKYTDSCLAASLSNAPNYFDVIKTALPLMNIKNGFDEEGIMRRGLVIRHLVLPGYSSDSIAVLDCIKEVVGADAVISLMSQFIPFGDKLTRRLKPIEYKRVVFHAQNLGFENGYIQSPDSANADYIPNFSDSDE